MVIVIVIVIVIEFGLDPTITQDRAILLFWGPKKMIAMIPERKKEKKQETNTNIKKIIN